MISMETCCVFVGYKLYWTIRNLFTYYSVDDWEYWLQKSITNDKMILLQLSEKELLTELIRDQQKVLLSQYYLFLMVS